MIKAIPFVCLQKQKTSNFQGFFFVQKKKTET